MTWAEFAAARKILVEEFVGRPIREAQSAEDAQVTEAKRAIREAQGVT